MRVQARARAPGSGGGHSGVAEGFAASVEGRSLCVRAALCRGLILRPLGACWLFSNECALHVMLLVKAPSVMKDYGDVDRWIAQLMECKPLSEAEVIQLCARVRISPIKLSQHSAFSSSVLILLVRFARFSRRKKTSSLCAAPSQSAETFTGSFMI